MGSSGFTKPYNRKLRAAVEKPAIYDRRIVVEQGISAQECEVAVLGTMMRTLVWSAVWSRLLISTTTMRSMSTTQLKWRFRLSCQEAISDKFEYALPRLPRIGWQGASRVDSL